MMERESKNIFFIWLQNAFSYKYNQVLFLHLYSKKV